MVAPSTLAVPRYFSCVAACRNSVTPSSDPSEDELCTDAYSCFNVWSVEDAVTFAHGFDPGFCGLLTYTVVESMTRISIVPTLGTFSMSENEVALPSLSF